MKPRSLPPDEPARQRRARPWRVMLVLSGLLLASTFFMPAVSGCNVPVVPAEEVEPLVSNPSAHGWVEFGQAFILYIAAYLWGLLIGIATLVRLLQKSSGSRALGCVPFAVVCLTAVLLILLNVADLLGTSLSLAELLGYVIALLICLALIAYGIVAVRRLGHRAYLALDFVGAVVAGAWFSGWTLGGYYGVRLSFAASLVILVGVFGESATLTRRTWFGAFWRLATCRLRDAELPLAACPKCHYDLHGAPELRCPECGRPFNFDELGLAPEEVAFKRHLSVE